MRAQATTLMLGALMLGAAASTRADGAPVVPLTANVALTSDYVFRGLTQTWGRPAIQGGADYANSHGFAAGLWASSVTARSYPGGTMELDVYASYGQAIDSDWSWRAGLYAYLYPGANLDHAGLARRSFDTVEANGALSWKWLTLKYNRALTDYFGTDREQGYRGGSRGASYLQLDAAIPLGQPWSLTLHAGRAHYGTTLATALASGARDPDYSDYGAVLKYALGARWSLSAGITHASNARFYRRTTSFLDPRDTANVGGSRGFLVVQGSF